MSYSHLVSVCEDIWSNLQKYHLDIPNAFIVVGSGGRRAKTLYGHFAKDMWELEGEPIHEVLLVAEQLNRSAEEVFTTILHEAVHGIATVRGIRDCSGKRHNRKFADLCLEVDMIPPEVPDKTLGYSAATLSSVCKSFYAAEIIELEKALSFSRKLVAVDGQSKKSLWAAECGCGRKIRLGKQAIAGEPQALAMTCDLCLSSFELIEEYE